MADRALTSDELTALIARFPVERVGGKTPSEITDTQVQHLLARMAALTDALRDAKSNDTTRLASRMLLSDLTLVAGQFRGNANAVRASLVKALEDLRSALEKLSRADGPT